MFLEILNKIIVYGVDHQASQVFCSGLLQEVALVGVYGAYTDKQLVGDFLVATLFDDELENFFLPVS